MAHNVSNSCIVYSVGIGKMLWPTPEVLLNTLVRSFAFFLNLVLVKQAQIGVGYRVAFDLHTRVGAGLQFLPVHHVESWGATGLGWPIVLLGNVARCKVEVGWHLGVFQDRAGVLEDGTHSIIKGDGDRVVHFRAKEVIQAAYFNPTVQNLFDHSGKGFSGKTKYGAPVINAVESENGFHTSTVLKEQRNGLISNSRSSQFVFQQCPGKGTGAIQIVNLVK